MKCLLLFLALLSPSWADPAKLAGAAHDLGHEKFEKREAALKKMRSLIAKPADKKPALQKLRQLWQAETDPEIRARLFNLASELSVPQKGSLFGFRFMVSLPLEIEGAKTLSIRVEEVIGDTPAAKAGLQVHDLIVGVDNQLIGPRRSLDEILLLFKLLPPDEIHSLRIRRGDKNIILKIDPDEQDLTKQDQEAFKKRFIEWFSRVE